MSEQTHVRTQESPSAPRTSAEEPEGPGVSTGRETRADWLRALRYCGLVYLGVRAGLFLVGLLSTALLPRLDPSQVPGYTLGQPAQGWHNVFTAWERFDALWYLRIAESGYRNDDGSGAFFPLYPLLIRAFSTVTGRPLLSAYLVSNIALVVGLVLLYRLTATEFSERVARRTVLYLCVFPTGLFLFAPYTESLFLALTVGCLLAARRHAWLLAGSLGALASLTRSSGLLLAAPLAIEALLQWRRDARPAGAALSALIGRLGAAGAVGLGIGSYLLYWNGRGEWRRPLDLQQSQWGKESALPWETLWSGVKEGTKYLGGYPGGYHTLDLVVVLVVLVAGVWVAWRVPLTYSVYFWVSVTFPLLLMFGGRPLLSLPRYYLVVFPLYWALARFADRWRAHDVVVAACACGLGLMSVLFVNWYFLF